MKAGKAGLKHFGKNGWFPWLEIQDVKLCRSAEIQGQPVVRFNQLLVGQEAAASPTEGDPKSTNSSNLLFCYCAHCF